MTAMNSLRKKNTLINLVNVTPSSARGCMRVENCATLIPSRCNFLLCAVCLLLTDYGGFMKLKKILKRGIVLEKGTIKGWYYLSIFGWLPFKWAQHSGWFYLSFSWFWRFAVTVPKQRGWRWD